MVSLHNIIFKHFLIPMSLADGLKEGTMQSIQSSCPVLITSCFTLQLIKTLNEESSSFGHSSKSLLRKKDSSSSEEELCWNYLVLRDASSVPLVSDSDLEEDKEGSNRS